MYFSREYRNLAGNKITKLTSEMFKGLHRLSILHLEENEIHTIENNTFAPFRILNMVLVYVLVSDNAFNMNI